METKKTWAQTENEPNKPYKYFQTYLETGLSIKEFHMNIPKIYQNYTKKNPKPYTPPSLNTLYIWSKTYHWKSRKKDYTHYMLEKERQEIEKIGHRKRIERLKYSNDRFNASKKIMDEAMNDKTLKANSKAYVLAQTAASDKISMESDRLDTNQSTERIENNIKNESRSVFKELTIMKKEWVEYATEETTTDE